MRFWNPGPKATAAGCERIKDSSVRQRVAPNNAVASRFVVGANGRISLGVYCKPNGNYAGAKGTDIIVTLYRASAGRFALQFFNSDGTQIDGTAVATGGLANMPAALAAKALLDPHFSVRVGNTADQAQDAGVGAANGARMTIK